MESYIKRFVEAKAALEQELDGIYRDQTTSSRHILPLLLQVAYNAIAKADESLRREFYETAATELEGALVQLKNRRKGDN